MTRSGDGLRSAELAASRAELREAGEEAEALAGGLTEAQLRWRPEPERWSVGECLDHLVRTGEVYLDVLDGVIEEARLEGRTGAGPYRRSLVGRWLVRFLEPPPGLPVPAPLRVRPRLGSRREGTDPRAPADGAANSGPRDPLGAFLALRPRYEECLRAADGLDLGRVRMSSPFVSFLRFDLGSAFRVVAAHERRHLWQARRVTEAEGFPAE